MTYFLKQERKVHIFIRLQKLRWRLSIKHMRRLNVHSRRSRENIKELREREKERYLRIDERHRERGRDRFFVSISKKKKKKPERERERTVCTKSDVSAYSWFGETTDIAFTPAPPRFLKTPQKSLTILYLYTPQKLYLAFFLLEWLSVSYNLPTNERGPKLNKNCDLPSCPPTLRTSNSSRQTCRQSCVYILGLTWPLLA